MSDINPNHGNKAAHQSGYQLIFICPGDEDSAPRLWGQNLLSHQLENQLLISYQSDEKAHVNLYVVIVISQGRFHDQMFTSALRRMPLPAS